MWRYVLTPRAQRDLRALDLADRARVLAALDRFVIDPSTGDVKKLQGTEDEWRLRVGSWRIRFTRDTAERIVVVLRVLPRKDAYRE